MKAQSALEYLITYGWVILVIVVVLGLLNFLGVFNLQRWVTGDDVVVGLTTIKVTSFRVVTSGAITLYLVNNANAAISLTAIAINGTSLTSVSPALPQTISAGQNLTITGNSVLTGNVGDVFINEPISFTFNVINGASNHMDSGIMSGHLDQ